MIKDPFNRIGEEFIYFDKISEERYSVQLVGVDAPDDMGLVFVYLRAIDDNGSKNDKQHPVYGDYYVITEASDVSIIDPNDVDEMIYEVDNFMKYYRKD